jgi:hypothetical protein
MLSFDLAAATEFERLRRTYRYIEGFYSFATLLVYLVMQFC